MASADNKAQSSPEVVMRHLASQAPPLFRDESFAN